MKEKQVMKLFEQERQGKISLAEITDRVSDNQKLLYCGEMFRLVQDAAESIREAKYLSIAEILEDTEALMRANIKYGMVARTKICTANKWGTSDYKKFLRYLAKELSKDNTNLYVIQNGEFDWFLLNYDLWREVAFCIETEYIKAVEEIQPERYIFNLTAKMYTEKKENLSISNWGDFTDEEIEKFEWIINADSEELVLKFYPMEEDCSSKYLNTNVALKSMLICKLLDECNLLGQIRIEPINNYYVRDIFKISSKKGIKRLIEWFDIRLLLG